MCLRSCLRDHDSSRDSDVDAVVDDASSCFTDAGFCKLFATAHLDDEDFVDFVEDFVSSCVFVSKSGRGGGIEVFFGHGKVLP